MEVGLSKHFPEGMRSFNRSRHDGLILDDVRDLQFLVDHQEKLQGKYSAPVEFANDTPGGTCAYWKDMFAVPVVVTANFTTANLDLLRSNDFLRKRSNRLVVDFEVDGGRWLFNFRAD